MYQEVRLRIGSLGKLIIRRKLSSVSFLLHKLSSWPFLSYEFFLYVVGSIFYNFVLNFNILYSARRLIGSRIIESAAYCNQKLLAHLYLGSTQNTSVNWIIRLLLSLLCRPNVILLSGGHCSIIKPTPLLKFSIQKWVLCEVQVNIGW